MKFLQPIGAILRGWTDSVAAAVIAAFDRVSSPRLIRLIEQEQGGFTVEGTGKSDNLPRKLATGYVEAVSRFHAAAVAVCTEVAERNAGRVKVFEQKARGHLDAKRLSRALFAGFGISAACALLGVVAAVYMADHLGAQEDEV